jgi:hypothetical protein
MWVGDRDKDWNRAMTQQAAMFGQRGLSVQFLSEEDQGHALDLGPEGISQLFDDLDKAAGGCSK